MDRQRAERLFERGEDYAPSVYKRLLAKELGVEVQLEPVRVFKPRDLEGGRGQVVVDERLVEAIGLFFEVAHRRPDGSVDLTGMGPGRRPEGSTHKHAAWHCLLKLGWTLGEVAEAVGCQTHTTILRGARSAADKASRDPRLRRKMREAEDLLCRVLNGERSDAINAV